jgi:FKBP-type peptidyl-prolyl cis-trans isomerase 2
MNEGDVIEFDYELFVEGQDGLYDTTIQEKAEAAGLAQRGAYHAPMRYVVGAGRLIPGLEDALLKADEGKGFDVTIPPERAYGPREAGRVETIPMKEFRKADVDPRPGMSINWNARRGVVTTVGGGRVRVDFNPPLAGKTLRYVVTVRRIYREPAERLAGLLLMNYPAPDPPEVTIEDKTAVVVVPEPAKYDPNWPRAKLGFLASVRRHADVESVRFVEEHTIDREPVAPQEPPEGGSA